jgi:hypothetical protein
MTTHNLLSKGFAFLVIGMMCMPLECNAQDLRLANQLKFQDILASRQGDHRTYILLGSGWLRTIRSGDSGRFITRWLQEHPSATVQPVSHQFMTNRRWKRTDEMVYIWVEDGKTSLNVDLVRAGIFPGGVMMDMVDNLKGLNEVLKDPKLADTRAQVEKERAEAPQDITERLMSEDDYGRHMQSVEFAEARARQEKLGIWSDAMKAERQAEGYP